MRQADVAGGQVVGRGRRHVAAADPAIGLDALVPALGMQKALLEGRQLLSQGQLAVRAQGHGPQVFRLGPDTLGCIAYRTIERQHRRHSPAVWIDTLRLGVGERAGHGFMQLAPVQFRRRLQQEEPFELMTWLVPVIHSAQRLLQHHAGCRIDETALHVDNQRVQCRLRGRVGTHRQGGQKGLCQMHQGVLQRAGAQHRPVFIELRLVQPVVVGKAFCHNVKRCVEHRLCQRVLHFRPVMRAGKNNEGVGVEVLAAIQRLALWIDAVEPAAMLGIVEVLLQGTEQLTGPRPRIWHLCVIDEAGEQKQLTRTGHGAIALRRQRLIAGVECFVGQCQLRVPPRTLPQRNDDLHEVLLQGGEQRGQFRRGGGTGHMRHRLASRQCRSAQHVIRIAARRRVMIVPHARRMRNLWQSANQRQSLVDRGFDPLGIQAALGEHLRRLGVLDVDIRQAQVQYRLEDIGAGQELADRSTGTAHDGVFFQCDQQLVIGGSFAHQGFVQWFDEAHVDHCCVELLGHHQRLGQLHAERQYRNALALTPHNALADLDRFKIGLDHRIRAGAAWVAHCRRAGMQVTGAEQLAQFVFIARRHHQHARDAAQVGEVEAACVSRAVFAYQSGAVDGEQYVEVLYRDVVDQLIVATLQEGRIDRHHRLAAFAGHTGSQGHCVLFGDGHVEVTLGEAFAERDQVRTFLHRRRDADQPCVSVGHVTDPLAEHAGVFRCADLFLRGRRIQRLELGDGVIADRIDFGRLKTLALFGHHMQKLRALQVTHVAQGGDQGRQVVAVDRTDIVPAQLFEERARDQHAFGVLLGAPRYFPGTGKARKDLFAAFTHAAVGAAGKNLGQVIRQPADIARDRHVVVVEDHQHVGGHFRRVVQRFEGHTGSQRPVADHGNRFALAALQARGNRHAQRGADRGAGVPDTKGVVLAFAATRKGRNPVLLAQGGHARATAGEDLVRIGLMTHVPHQTVVRGVENVMQRDGQLDDP
ncbi:hypothetical protein ALQ91_05472 [Pseudomonas syringae pv. syringae]|nr:hypothetical protein ALQ91_05472 [Pseudomonas syringae pv. syringae]